MEVSNIWRFYFLKLGTISGNCSGVMQYVSGVAGSESVWVGRGMGSMPSSSMSISSVSGIRLSSAILSASFSEDYRVAPNLYCRNHLEAAKMFVEDSSVLKVTHCTSASFFSGSISLFRITQLDVSSFFPLLHPWIALSIYSSVLPMALVKLALT